MAQMRGRAHAEPDETFRRGALKVASPHSGIGWLSELNWIPVSAETTRVLRLRFARGRAR